MLQDRRQHLRVAPNWPVSVRWGESKSGLLFDLCEDGLAVDGVPPESGEDEVISLAFDLPKGHGHIQARGEIAWTNDSVNRTGLRFVALAHTSRQQLREWISTRADTTRLAATEKEFAQPVFVIPATDSVAPPRHLIWFVLGALSICLAVVFLRHYAHGVGDNRQVAEITAAGKVPENLDLGSTVKPSPATTSALPPTLPLNVPGFVVQVAAMKHEENADALAETLHQRDFPAFVFRRGADPFYRVAVGGYSDASSAAIIKEGLERQGFKAILRRWLPE
jgi:hypothetical protein